MLRQDFVIFQAETQTGIHVEIGASLLLLGFVMVHLVGGAAAFLYDLAIFLTIVFSLHLREMARAWMVQLHGLRLDGVVLSGAGGRTLHARGTTKQEELIAITGPLTSFALWAGANLILTLLPDGEIAHWLRIFAFINLFIGIFTILPIQPLDGGRFFYLWLGRVLGHRIANRLMGGIGLLLSLIWLPACLLAFIIFGMVLIALPSVQEHWAMLKGDAAIED
ncbi:MAG: hypothetical protein AAGF88_06755 [Pseudomonadota bacterium]